jgi:mannan polymerase II complex MNN10 subunit
LIRTMPQNELEQHVRIAEMQCAFNSYLWRPSLKNGRRLVVLPRTVWQGSCKFHLYCFLLQSIRNNVVG